MVTDYRKADFNLASKLLPPTAWEHHNNNLNDPIEDMWTVFRDKLLEVQRTTVPMKSKRINGAMDPPFMTIPIKREREREREKKKNTELQSDERADTTEARTQ